VQHLHILVEGQTEETVVKNVIAPHLSSEQTYVTVSIFTTKRPAGGPAYKGGLARWSRVRRELQLLLRDSSITALTTLFDYYAFPDDAPGMIDRPNGSPYDRVQHVEQAICHEINDGRFLPNLVLHELEAWVLADCVGLGKVMGNIAGASALSRIVGAGSGPELINEGSNTAPSKRILNVYPNYRKTIDGPTVIEGAGLASIRQLCPHADQWLTDIEVRLKAPPDN
jgi:hypothetical protein